jgi:energy-coupling factor transporter ATP-binding protein EcfA2
MALLEADVALPVVRDFIARVKDKALGTEVVGSLNPGQALVGVVHKELAATMGEGVSDINLATQPPAVILMAGLQGAGKTTTTAKLAKHLIEKRKKKVLTVSADVYRPAAIEQLKTVTRQAGAEWFPSTPEQKPHDIALAAIDHAPALLRRAAGRHRRPPGHRRGADGRDPRPARHAETGRDAVRRRRHAGPGRGQHRQGLQGGAAADRHRADQARRRLAAAARRCRCARSPARRSSSPACPRRSTAWRSSTPSAMPAACWAWATSWPWSRGAAGRRPGRRAEAGREGQVGRRLRSERLPVADWGR